MSCQCLYNYTCTFFHHSLLWCGAPLCKSCTSYPSTTLRKMFKSFIHHLSLRLKTHKKNDTQDILVTKVSFVFVVAIECEMHVKRNLPSAHKTRQTHRCGAPPVFSFSLLYSISFFKTVVVRVPLLLHHRWLETSDILIDTSGLSLYFASKNCCYWVRD